MSGGGLGFGGVTRAFLSKSGWRAPSACAALIAACALASCKGESKTDSPGSGATGGTGANGTTGGTSGSGGSTTTAVPVAAANFGQSFAVAFCAIGACCQSQGYAYTQASCEAAVKAYLDAAVNTALQTNGVVFDEKVAGACTDAYRKLVQGCTDPSLDRATQAACNGLFHGTIPEGGACTADAACADIPGVDQVECNEGVCAPSDSSYANEDVRAKLGETCGGTCENTSASLGCSSFSSSGNPPANAPTCFLEDGLYCTDAFVCATLPKIGEPCPDYECAEDSYCNGSVCVAGVATGPCPYYRECLHTSYCDSTTNVCTPFKANGVACNYDSECSSDNCVGDVCREWSVANTGSCSGLVDD